MMRLQWFAAVVLCFGVVGNVHADVWYMDDAEVTVTGHLETTMWHGEDNGWDYGNDSMWVWGSETASPLYGTTHKYLMTKYAEDSGLNPVTVELALENGDYNVGYVWYNHGHVLPSSVGLTIEGVNYDHTPVNPGINQFGTESEFGTGEAVSVTVTDGALTLVFGNTTGHGLNWFTVGQIDVSSTTAPERIPGDANDDGVVDDEDASILAAHWQAGPGATWGDGDFNNDSFVNDEDASILAAHWLETRKGTAVPEPTTVVMLLGGLLSLWIWRRK